MLDAFECTFEKQSPNKSSKKNNTERAYLTAQKKSSLAPLTAQICYPVSDPPPADDQAPIGPAAVVSRALEKKQEQTLFKDLRRRKLDCKSHFKDIDISYCSMMDHTLNKNLARERWIPP